MEIDRAPIGLSPAFGDDPAKQTQWSAFLKRSSLTKAPNKLSAVVEELHRFFATILDFPAPMLSGYSRETVVAEKLQALVQLRLLNTADEGLLRPLAVDPPARVEQ